MFLCSYANLVQSAFFYGERRATKKRLSTSVSKRKEIEALEGSVSKKPRFECGTQ